MASGGAGGAAGTGVGSVKVGLSGIRYVPDVTPSIHVGLLMLDRKRGGFVPEWGAEVGDDRLSTHLSTPTTFRCLAPFDYQHRRRVRRHCPINRADASRRC